MRSSILCYAFVLPSLQVRSIEWEGNGTYKGIT